MPPSNCSCWFEVVLVSGHQQNTSTKDRQNRTSTYVASQKKSWRRWNAKAFFRRLKALSRWCRRRQNCWRPRQNFAVGVNKNTRPNGWHQKFAFLTSTLTTLKNNDARHQRKTLEVLVPNREKIYLVKIWENMDQEGDTSYFKLTQRERIQISHPGVVTQQMPNFHFPTF